MQKYNIYQKLKLIKIVIIFLNQIRIGTIFFCFINRGIITSNY